MQKSDTPQTDVRRAAPSTLFVMDPAPAIPSIVLLKDGVDLEAQIVEALGGECEGTRPPTSVDERVGVISIHVRGDRKVYVFTGDVTAQLTEIVERLRSIVSLEQQLKGAMARIFGNDPDERLTADGKHVVKVRALKINKDGSTTPVSAEEALSQMKAEGVEIPAELQAFLGPVVIDPTKAN